MGLSINPIVSFKQTKTEKTNKNQPLGGKIIAPAPSTLPKKQTPPPLAGDIKMPPTPVFIPPHPPYTTAGVIVCPEYMKPKTTTPPLAGLVRPPEEKPEETEKPLKKDPDSDV